MCQKHPDFWINNMYTKKKMYLEMKLIKCAFVSLHAENENPTDIL